MALVTDEELIQKAKSLLKPIKIRHGFTAADVGCALLTKKGDVYLGVCIDAIAGMGFCAEQSAIAAMITAGEYRIKKIVAVSEFGIIPPYGKCREFMHQIHDENLDADVIIANGKTVKLRELLPFLWDK